SGNVLSLSAVLGLLVVEREFCRRRDSFDRPADMFFRLRILDAHETVSIQLTGLRVEHPYEIGIAISARRAGRRGHHDVALLRRWRAEVRWSFSFCDQLVVSNPRRACFDEFFV